MEIRARFIVGFALLAIGLLISVSVWNTILAWQGDVLGKVYIDHVKPRNRILFPLAFIVFEVPDYLLRYLLLGVFTTTVGLAILAPPAFKRLSAGEGEI